MIEVTQITLVVHATSNSQAKSLRTEQSLEQGGCLNSHAPLNHTFQQRGHLECFFLYELAILVQQRIF
jgi:hypothetical protein